MRRSYYLFYALRLLYKLYYTTISERKEKRFRMKIEIGRAVDTNVINCSRKKNSPQYFPRVQIVSSDVGRASGRSHKL